MKIIVLLFLVSVSSSLYAQNFEGIVKVADRVQVGSAEETQAMEERVKGPLRKEIAKKKKKLNSKSLTPAQRASLAAEIKSQEETISLPLMSNIVEVCVKNRNFCLKFRNGTSANLMLDSASKVYDISHNRKTFQVDDTKPFSTFGNAPEVIKTSEMATFMNTSCVKYVVKSTDQEKKAVGTFWVAPDIKDVEWKYVLMFEDEDSTLFSQIVGLPLKVEVISGNVAFFKDVLSIERIAVADSNFEIPAGYQEILPTADTKKEK
ncbi:hypothetical protein [Pseudochryseolinea flava]|uniref:DUF4412 domain-containing protein n=1 Tax=Pseudochryseolinea flava TaxID=2059302 RepID=A0A364XW61_9BACT|nr:hypothetical protein [Pseudochryseolinea flava]RAV98371.1 hypothetical protein DQQ10_23870 [Pseudochryseolinea flava]